MIRAILACDDDWGIGKDGDLPWPHNPADLKWFKENTVGGVVVMGKATWDSLPTKPLPQRNNIVVTRDVADKDQGNYHFITFDNAKASLQQMSALQNVWIIGGAQLVEGMISIIDEVWLSRVDGKYNCDTYLPKTIIELVYELYQTEANDDLHIQKWRKIDGNGPAT